MRKVKSPNRHDKITGPTARDAIREAARKVLHNPKSSKAAKVARGSALGAPRATTDRT